MEWIRELVWEIVWAVLGVTVTALAARAGSAVRRLLSEQETGEGVRALAAVCVSAVEQMDKTLSGEEKMERALGFFSDLLAKRGIRLCEEEMRVFLESALAEFKGAFSGE